MRLYCFHHAGGGASFFRGWQRALGPHVEVAPVELPGREASSRETRFVKLDPLLAKLDDELDGTAPHIFFGHSMGALIAYRLACRRRDRGGPLPTALILSAYAPPHLRAPLPADEAFLPAQLRAWPELMQRVMPVLHDDLAICESDDGTVSLLPCAMWVFGADADPLVDEVDLDGWARYTNDFRGATVFRGDHFYLSDRPDALFDAIRPILLSSETIGRI